MLKLKLENMAWISGSDGLPTINPRKSERHNLPDTHSPGPPQPFHVFVE